MTMHAATIAAVALSVLLTSLGAAHGAQTPSSSTSLAILPFGFLDTSGEPRDQTAEHAARLGAMTDQLRSQLEAGGRYRTVELPEAAIESCQAQDSACLLTQARQAGADLVMTGAVQKVSSLILEMWVGVFDVATGARVYYRNLSFRGDNDEAWRRATSFLLRQIEKDPPKKP
jgi:hypothetical protein